MILNKIIKGALFFIIINLIILFLYIIIFENIAFLGKRFKNNITVLDLTSLPINEDTKWEESLGKFKKLKKVVIKDKIITIEKKLELQKKYPKIIFDVLAIGNIQGEQVQDNAEFIEISNPIINENIIDELKLFPNIKRIKFSDDFTDKEIQLKLINEFPDKYYNWNVKIANKVISSTTTKLNLANANINDLEDFRNSLILLQKLEYLDLSDSNLDNETLYQLNNDFANIEIVWTIKMSKWTVKTDQVAFSVLIKNFAYYPLTSKDLELFKYCPKLQALDLGHQKITDLSPISRYLPNLRVLILADNPITDISPLSSLKHLHYLEIFMTNIKDISPLINNQELVDLNFSNTYITNISPLIENDFPLIERIWMSNVHIKQNDLNLLTKKYPNTEIINIGSGSTDFGWRTHSRYKAMINMFYDKYTISDDFTKYDSID